MRVGYRALLMQGRIDCVPSRQEQQLHDKAIEFYTEALASLNKRSSHPALWDSINRDLGGAFLAFSKLLLAGPAADVMQVSQLLHKALHHFEDELRVTSCTEQPERFFEALARTADCHHMLGNCCAADPQYFMKNLGKLVDRHFEKAVEVYSRNDFEDTCASPSAALLVYVDWAVACCNGEPNVARLKAALKVLQDAEHALNTCQGREFEEDEEANLVIKTLARFERQLHEVLRQLLQASKQQNKDKQAAVYKRLYGAVLKETANKCTGLGRLTVIAQCLAVLKS